MSEDHIWKVAQSVGFDDYELRPMLEAFAAALSQPAPSPQAPGRRKGPPGITLEPQGHEQPAVPVVSDEQIIDKIIRAGFTYYTTQRTMDEMRADIRAILDLRPADHPDTLRCIKARNDLNAALHGEGASIDDLEHAVANACAKLRRPAVEPMTDVWAMADIEQACVMAEVPPAQFESIALWLETEGAASQPGQKGVRDGRST